MSASFSIIFSLVLYPFIGLEVSPVVFILSYTMPVLVFSSVSRFKA